MIQNRTKILIKDNSGLLKGTVINSKPRRRVLGHHVKLVITKAKLKTTGSKRGVQSKVSQLQDALIIQTNNRIQRYDGSGLRFSSNCGVSITTNKRKLNLGFKRIATSCPFEIKRLNNQSAFKGSYNIMKLAKNLL